MKKEAELWEIVGSSDNQVVQCHVCAHHCVIKPNELGTCKTRKNIDGILYSLIYGSLISSGTVDPIEKKPLYHFYPNASAFSIATIGCNLKCKHCQNWQISKSFPDINGKIAQFCEEDKRELHAHNFNLTELSSEQVVERAKRVRSKIIAYTYNEPLIWYEFVKKTALLAKEEGMKNVLVTGGYSSSQANKEYVKFIDAANIDFKGFTNEFYQKFVGVPNFKPILETAEFFKTHGIHIEITNLIIPNENDNLADIQRMTEWISTHLGNETPLHFSAYHPEYRTNEPSTSPKTLEKAWEIAKKVGLKYVYIGNVLSSKGNSTLCPNCGVEVIHRRGYHIENINLTDQNTCAKCGKKVAIKGNFSNSSRSFFL